MATKRSPKKGGRGDRATSTTAADEMVQGLKTDLDAAAAARRRGKRPASKRDESEAEKVRRKGRKREKKKEGKRNHEDKRERKYAVAWQEGVS